eukprot:2684310-Alexandrium_andersonii.AAC.1
MSASLVGSEMCIRDSALPSCWRPRWAGARSGLGRATPRCRSRTTLSVSYTHLTLPTICSV